MTERENALARLGYWAEVATYDTEAGPMAEAFCKKFAAEALRYGATQADVDAAIQAVAAVARA